MSTFIHRIGNAILLALWHGFALVMIMVALIFALSGMNAYSQTLDNNFQVQLMIDLFQIMSVLLMLYPCANFLAVVIDIFSGDISTAAVIIGNGINRFVIGGPNELHKKENP